MRSMSLLLATLLILASPAESSARAEAVSRRVVDRGERRDTAAVRSLERDRDVQQIRLLLRHQEILARFGGLVDLERIDITLSMLDDATLSRLATDCTGAKDRLLAAGRSSEAESCNETSADDKALLVIMIVLGALAFAYYKAVLNFRA